jgi:hypothetical protein
LVNPVIAWQIGDNTELTFEYEYRNVQLPNDFGLPAVGTIFRVHHLTYRREVWRSNALVSVRKTHLLVSSEGRIAF